MTGRGKMAKMANFEDNMKICDNTGYIAPYNQRYFCDLFNLLNVCNQDMAPTMNIHKITSLFECSIKGYLNLGDWRIQIFSSVKQEKNLNEEKNVLLYNLSNFGGNTF